jgi:hypothetical protein
VARRAKPIVNASVPKRAPSSALTRSISWDFARACAPRTSPVGIVTACRKQSGSWRQPGRWRSNSAARGGVAHVGGWMPFVIERIV